MTRKEQRTIAAKINKAMLLLMDAQDLLAGTDEVIARESTEGNFQRVMIHDDISKAVSNLHWANGRIE